MNKTDEYDEIDKMLYDYFKNNDEAPDWIHTTIYTAFEKRRKKNKKKLIKIIVSILLFLSLLFLILLIKTTK